MTKPKRVELTLLETCEMHKEERDVLEEYMRQIDECDWEKLSTLDIVARKRSLS